jgi:hypothetical protein
MKVPAKIVAWVLPWFLTGCWFYRSQKQPAQQVAPSIANSNVPPPTQDPPPALTIPTKPGVVETRLPYESIRQPYKHRRQPAASPTVLETQQPPTQQAASLPPAVNAIGQLSSGDPGGTRQATENTLNDIERGLNGISRQFDDQEQTTASHIREFLKQAREALKSGDVDGASTLAAKAKVLLQELTR